MSKALELAKFGRETPPAGVVVGDSDAQTLSSKTFSDMPVFSSGTVNTVAYLNASKVLSSSTSLSFDGSNLGVGVASPAATLDVYGGASGRLQIYSSASGNFLTSKVAANTGYQILNYLGSQHVWGDGTTTRMTIDASGNLGVGTATPASKFAVNGGTVNTTTYTSSEARIADGSIHAMKTVAGGVFEAFRAINLDTTAGTTVRVLGAATSDPFNNANGGKVFIDAVRTATNMDLVFLLNDTGGAAPVERVRFMGSGNVGIGTASPTVKLEVAGAAKLTGTNLAIVPSSTGASAYLVNTNASGNLFFGIDNNTGASFGAGAYARVLYSSAAYPMAFFTNDLERMRITSAGLVGIGTSSPSYKLDVQGGNLRLQTEGAVTQFATFAYSSTQTFHDARWTAWRARGTAASPAVVVAGDELSAWEISGYNGSGGWTYAAGIRVYATGTISGTTVPTYMTFDTNSGSTATERMRISSDGLAVTGALSTTGNVSVSSTNPTLTFTRTDNGTTPAASINFSATSTVKWQIATNQAIGPGLEFNAGNATSNKMYLTTTGNLLVGGTTSYGGTMTLLPVGGNPTSASSSLNQLHIGEASNNTGYSLKLGYTFIGGGYQGNIQAMAGGAAGPLLLNADGGFVGIGTNFPGQKLEIAGSSQTDIIYTRIANNYGSLTSNGAGAALQFVGWDAGVTANIKSIRAGQSYSPSALTFETFGGASTVGTNALVERMRIDGYGNVLIGTTTSTVSAAKLQIQTPASQTNAIDVITTGGTTNNGGSFGMFSDAVYISSNWYYAGSQLKRIAANGSANIVLAGASTDAGTYIAFATGTTAAGSPSEKMRIKTDGNVGIGTTNPSVKLNVVGTEYVILGETLSSTNGDAVRLSLKSPVSQGQVELEWWNDSTRTGGGYGLIQTGKSNNSPDFAVQCANFGIGLTNPEDKLHVNGAIRSNASTTGTLHLGQTSGGATYVAAALVATPSTIYAPVGKLSFRLPTHGANTDYGLTEQMALEGTGADSRGAYKLTVLPHGGRFLFGSSSVAAAKVKFTLTSNGSLGNIANVGSFGVNGVFSLGGVTNNNEGIYLGTGGVDGDGVACGFGFLREAGGWNSALAFYTNNVTSGPNGVSAIQEKMRLTSGGTFAVGQTGTTNGTGVSLQPNLATAAVGHSGSFATVWNIPTGTCGLFTVHMGGNGQYGGAALFFVTYGSYAPGGNASVTQIVAPQGDQSGYTWSWQVAANGQFQMRNNTNTVPFVPVIAMVTMG